MMEKMVVMKDDTMMIKIEHNKDMRNRCIELEKQVKELSGEHGGFGSKEKFEDNRSGN